MSNNTANNNISNTNNSIINNFNLYDAEENNVKLAPIVEKINLKTSLKEY